MRGYFGIGVEGVSKAMNAGSLFRTAHAFDASFLFTIAPTVRVDEMRRADTSDSPGRVPYYEFADPRALSLPRGCKLVGVELVEGATELPSFRHPSAAAYVLGGERVGLSPELLALCDLTVKIPMRFSVNLAIAGAIVLYDRLISLGRFPGRPLVAGGKPLVLPQHAFGEPLWRRKRAKRTREAAKKARKAGATPASD